MKIKYVEIKNFRSIENIKINFDPKCRVLVGINEVGKSNTLKALSLLSDDFSPGKDDLREPLPNEKPIDISYVRFIFELEEKELKYIYSNIKQEVLSKDIKKPLVKINGELYNLEKLCRYSNEALYDINIREKTKNPKYWALSEKWSIIGNWQKPKNGKYSIKIKKKDVDISKFALINTKEYKEIPPEYLEKIEPDYLNETIGGHIVEVVENNLPKVIFWKYTEKNLLPPSIPIATFTADPNSCVPLMHMFLLAGIKENEIAKAINEAQNRSSNAFRNLLKRVSNATTKYFREVWKEYKSIKFSLLPNGSNIDCGVEEKNIYNFAQRSDGFKRFVTFLLIISSQVKEGVLENVLLLVDDADINLHPSGCKFLRDELIKISEKNYVAYSTHSIFMIDRNNLRRHLLVKKVNEKTMVEDASESNIVDEEVLYNAVGASVFEVLKEKNIIFEGWQDKHLFQVALSRVPAKYKNIKKFFKNIGKCHAVGAKDIKRISSILELGNRKCFILSDGDDVAKEKQREYRKMKGYGIWKRCDEIYQGRNILTGEDFIKKDVLQDTFFEILKNKNPKFSEEDFDLPEVKRLEYIKQWLNKHKIIGQDGKQIIYVLKERVFNNLSPKYIENDYYEFLILLKECLE